MHRVRPLILTGGTTMRRHWTTAVTTCVFALVWVSLAGAGFAADRPNILFLFSDDQNTKTVGCYPESWSWVKTPNIDQLASRGVRFRHCYMGSWCMPSRANFLTGRYPHAIESMRMEGPYPGSAYDPEKCPFFPRVFRA